MTDEQFMSMMEGMRDYLQTPKTFIINPERVRELNYAHAIAEKLFPDAKIEITDDPLQSGAKIFKMTAFDISCAKETEYVQFAELIALTDNFEFYAVNGDEVCFAATFHDCLIKI